MRYLRVARCLGTIFFLAPGIKKATLVHVDQVWWFAPTRLITSRGLTHQGDIMIALT
ncbi:unnamed protein product [Ectocarpus sp. CCAP 1310/34]|nr:unnamed protein product [Ectocarpus sp. CCAP 1310/34]